MAERRWFSRSGSEPPEFATGEAAPILHSGLSALLELESIVSHGCCHDRSLVPPGPDSSATIVRPDGGSALTVAGGLAATGTRVACFVTASADVPLVDRLRALAERRVPLVVYAVVHGNADIERLCAAECLVAVARTPAHALDLALVARHAAESALTPAVIALDLTGVARSFEILRPLPRELVFRFLGAAAESVEAPTPAQRMLFGARRRRVPRWFDLRRPTAHGLELPRPEREAAALGRRVFFDAELPAAVERAAQDYAELTGRDLGQASLHAPRKYDELLVTQGSAVDFTEAVADRLRVTAGSRIAVLGLTWRRPAAAAAVRDAAQRAKRVTVLERTPPPGGGRPPLLQEIAAILAGEKAEVRSAIHGRLSAPELAAALADPDWRELVLGVAAPATSSRFPRREVMLGQLRRDYPHLSELTRQPRGAAVDVRPAGSCSMALYLRADTWPESAIRDLFERLREHHGEQLRSTVERVEGALWRVEATFADTALTEPGADVPLDLLLIADPDHAAEWDALRDMRPGGTVVLASPIAAAGLSDGLPARWIELGRRLPLRMYRVAAGPSVNDRLHDLGDAAIAVRGGNEAQLEKVDLGERTLSLSPQGEQALPLAVRRLGAIGETYDNVARFWGEFDEPRREGLERSVPDPYLALGGVPPCTASLADNTARRDTLPVIDAARCDGCGECWIACPDSAIGAAAPGTVALLDRLGDAVGTGLADEATVGKLRRAHKQMGGRIDRLLAASETTALDEGLLREAFDWALDKLDFGEAARDTAGQYLQGLVEAVSALPLSVTEVFFRGPHSRHKGEGGLLALAVNPQSCQGCGICAWTCPRDAIDIEPQTPARIETMRRRWVAWEATPEVTDPVAAQDDAGSGPGPLSHVLMSRTALFSVTGGAESEPGSGARIAVRQVAAIVDRLMCARNAAHADELERTMQRLRELIRKELARGVDVDDLAQLGSALEALPGPAMDLGRVASRLDQLGESTRIDASRVQDLVRLAREIDEQQQDRDRGTGQAGFGVVVAGGAAVEWAARFPRNPFSVPVRVDLSGGALDTAAGLAEGLRAERWQQARQLRLARIAIDRPDQLPGEQARLAGTDRPALTDEEAAVVPPILVLTGSDALTGARRAGIERALAADVPLKIVVLDEADADSPAADLLLRTLARGSAFVLSASIAHPDHLFDGVGDAIRFHGPALIRIHAPSPRRHGFPKDRTLERARLAVNCRVAPLMRFDPGKQQLSLAGNPAPGQDWAAGPDGGESTPAVWAAEEQRYQDSELLAGMRGLTDPSVPGPNGADPASGENPMRINRKYVDVWRALQERARPPVAAPPVGVPVPSDRHVERLRRRLMELAGYGEQGAS